MLFDRFYKEVCILKIKCFVAVLVAIDLTLINTVSPVITLKPLFVLLLSSNYFELYGNVVNDFTD